MNIINNNKDGITPTMPPGKAAMIGLFLIFFLFQFGGAVLFLIIFGTDITNADINALRLLNVGGQILFILLPAILLAKLVYVDKLTPVFRIRVPKIKEAGMYVAGLAILMALLQNFIYVQNFIFQKLADKFSIFQSLKNIADKLDKIMESTYTVILNANSAIELLFVILVVAVTPAICEEMFFRGFTQKSLEYSTKPWRAILITSIAFALYHFNPYGLFALVLLASYLGFAAYQSNSIVIPMTLHFINNFVSVIAYYIWGSDELINTTNVNSEDFLFNLASMILLSVLFFIFLFFFKKNYYKFQ